MTNTNIIIIDGHRAVVSFDPEINMLRGEFIELNGGADFYATDVAGLLREGAISLREFRTVCNQRGIEPVKKFSGKFQVRTDEHMHADAVVVAAAKGMSLNQFVNQAIEHELACA